MTGKVTLLQRAEGDLKISKHIVKFELSDEVQLDIAAYHVQQAVEKTLKFMLAEHGVAHRKTHSILVLLDQLDRAKIPYPDWLYHNAETLTGYSEETRYGDNLVATKRKLVELVGLAQTMIMEERSRQESRQKEAPE